MEETTEGRMLLRIIIEVLGAPAEHVEETLRLLLSKMKEKPDFKVKTGRVYKAKPAGELFTSFAEVELYISGISDLPELCFEFMPSSIEILEPAEIHENPKAVSDFLNDLMGRMHEVDMRLKNAIAQNSILNRNLSTMMINLVTQVLKESDKDIDSLSANVGIEKEGLQGLMDSFVSQGIFLEKEGKYALNPERLKWTKS
jgi:hypothetical protein